MKVSAGRASDGVGLLVASAGLVGCGVHGAFAAFPGPVWASNHFVGLWLAGFVVFFALQALHVRHNVLRTPCAARTDIAFFLLTLVGVLLHLAGYCLSLRVEGIVWASLLLLSHLHIFVVYARLRTKAEDVFLVERCCSAQCCVAVLSWLGRVLTVLLLFLTSSGALYEGIGRRLYPPRGKLLSVPWDDASGRRQDFAVYCIGPRGESTVLLSAGLGEAGARLYGVQDSLARLGRRVCVADAPGSGAASPLLAGQTELSRVFPNFLRQLQQSEGEGPFVLAADGSAAQLAYFVATRHSDIPLKALVLLDAYPPDFEATARQRRHNLTEAELGAWRREAVWETRLEAQLARALGCPWSLMAYFVPPRPSYEAVVGGPRYQEFLFHQRVDKAWTTRYYTLGREPLDWWAAGNLSASVRLGALISAPSEADVREAECRPRHLSERECREELAANQLAIDARVSLVQRLGPASANASVVFAKGRGVDRDWFALTDPTWTATHINAFR